MSAIKTTVICLLSILFFSANAKTRPDTIDFWHVLYNNKIIAKFNEVTATPFVVIRIQTITTKDVLTVEYGCDTPCEDCTQGLYLMEDTLRKIELIKVKGTAKPLKISVMKLFTIWKTMGCKPLGIYYFDDRRNKYIFELNFSN